MYTKQSAHITEINHKMNGGAAMKTNQSITTYHSYFCFAFVLTVDVTVEAYFALSQQKGFTGKHYKPTCPLAYSHETAGSAPEV
jgi:hypothetical protein